MAFHGWTEVIVFTTFAIILCIIKICLLNCFLYQRRHNSNRLFPMFGPTVGLPETGIPENVIREYYEPPPSFDQALKTSIPVSHIVVDEKPPAYCESMNIGIFPAATQCQVSNDFQHK